MDSNVAVPPAMERLDGDDGLDARDDDAAQVTGDGDSEMLARGPAEDGER